MPRIAAPKIEFRDGFALIPERAFEFVANGNGNDRRVVLWVRSGGLCHWCREPMSFTSGKRHSMTIDHVTPRSKGGRSNLRNTVACCHACNSRKGSLDAAVFMARYQSPSFPARLAPREFLSSTECEP